MLRLRATLSLLLLVVTGAAAGFAAEAEAPAPKADPECTVDVVGSGQSARSDEAPLVDPHKYFLVLAGRDSKGREDGPVFAMLLKTDGHETLVETIGFYTQNSHRFVGTIPEPLYRGLALAPVPRPCTTLPEGECMQVTADPGSAVGADVNLRIELHATEFERALKIARVWQRRAREGALLYPLNLRKDLGMNTSVLLKEIVESLNRCGQKLALYKLDWQMNDELAVNYRAWQVPYQYVKRLRQLNESVHVSDEEFRTAWLSVRLSDAR